MAVERRYFVHVTVSSRGAGRARFMRPCVSSCMGGQVSSHFAPNNRPCLRKKEGWKGPCTWLGLEDCAVCVHTYRPDRPLCHPYDPMRQRARPHYCTSILCATRSHLVPIARCQVALGRYPDSLPLKGRVGAIYCRSRGWLGLIFLTHFIRHAADGSSSWQSRAGEIGLKVLARYFLPESRRQTRRGMLVLSTRRVLPRSRACVGDICREGEVRLRVNCTVCLASNKCCVCVISTRMMNVTLG